MSKGAQRSAAPVAARVRAAPSAAPARDAGAADLLALQRSSGNRAVAHLLDAPEVRSARSEAGSMVPPVVRAALAGGRGQPLAATQRDVLPPHLGSSAGAVRVHTDARAATSARAIGAHAYTVGRDVVFAPGQYAPQTGRGMTLLLHELTHVADIAAGKARPDAVYRQQANQPPGGTAPSSPPLTLPGG
ncbi:MAG TPA: DUF4157 domain-containing protein, partial [Reyranella sp.]|nr:DUF4157 domain-containing protein [Reyranella sp.]